MVGPIAHQLMLAAIVQHAEDLRHQRESYAVTQVARQIPAGRQEKQEAADALRLMRSR